MITDSRLFQTLLAVVIRLTQKRVLKAFISVLLLIRINGLLKIDYR